MIPILSQRRRRQPVASFNLKLKETRSEGTFDFDTGIRATHAESSRPGGSLKRIGIDESFERTGACDQASSHAFAGFGPTQIRLFCLETLEKFVT